MFIEGGQKSKRIEWIDFAKGITIILTIVGHTVGTGKNGSILRGLIFSFHMPLFFILSATTYKYSLTISDFFRKTKKAAYHLLIPATIVFFLNSVIQTILNGISLLDVSLWKRILYTYIFSSGVDTRFYDIYVPAMGIPWFFFALFLGRTIFDYCHLYFSADGALFIIITVVGLCGICIGNTQWMPFSMDIALAIMPLFFFGMQLRTFNISGNFIKISIYFIIWIATLGITFPDYNSWTYLELACRRYTLFPICYITAIAGVMFVLEVSTFCRKIKPLFYLISTVGKNSLYLLCVHIMDGCWEKIYMIEGQFRMSIKRVIVDLIIFSLILAINTLCRKWWMKLRVND